MKVIFGSGDISSIGVYAVKIMELLQLGKTEKGSVSAQSKYTSLSSRSFRSKPSKVGESKDNKIQVSDDVYIESDSLITMKFQWVQAESIEHYRVLGIFSKYYNKWFVHVDSGKIL